MMRTLKSIVALVAAAVIVGQLVTGQRAVIEPRDRRLPLLSNSAATRVLVRACGNCHSNHTDWPWYSRLAPFSWWIAQHVREGREKLDFEKYRYGKSVTNWIPCADSYRRAGCRHGCTPECIQRRNLMYRKIKNSFRPALRIQLHVDGFLEKVSTNEHVGEVGLVCRSKPPFQRTRIGLTPQLW